MTMKKKKPRTQTRKYRGISRIDQPSTRTRGWFVRAGFYKLRNGTYAPRHRKFFGDVSHGGKRKSLAAAIAYLAKITRKQSSRTKKVRRAA
jgi:hypothetical protein